MHLLSQRNENLYSHKNPQMFLAALLIAPPMEIIQMTCNGWTVRQTVVHPYHGMLLKNEGAIRHVHNLDGSK